MGKGDINRGAGFDVSPLVARVYGNLKKLALFSKKGRFWLDFT